ncbi:MAG: tetratricopeptide repeat protein [Bryobacteraceae bacterium]|nr:tetratricopeptide repeat protein [Bryobacteraceae bacterium]
MSAYTSSLRLAAAACLLSAVSPTQAQEAASTTAPPKSAKAAAYYHYSMGHIYSELAEQYGNKGNYAQRAIEHYKQAIKADPASTAATSELTDLYIRTGQIRAAAQEAEEAIQQNPDNLSARRILAGLYTRMIGDSNQGRINERMLKQAIEQYSRITEKDTQDDESWLMLGRLHKVAQNSVEAEKAYKKALEIDPESEEAMSGLAMVYADLGDNKRATELLRKVSDKNPNPRTLTALAGLYEQMREHALAAEALKRTLKVVPDNPEIKRALAQNLLYSDQLDEARKVYEELVEDDAKDTQSWLRLSQIHRQQRKFDKAREASAKAKALAPNDVEVRFNDVSLLEAEGKTQDAINSLKHVLAETAKKSYTAPERNNRVILLERLGNMYRSAEQVEPAVETFRSISELDPDLGARASAQIIETYRLGKLYQKADQESAAALAKYPEDRAVKTVRASVLAEVGKPKEAVALLNTLFDGKGDRETHLSIAQIHERTKNFSEMAKSLDAAHKLSDSKEEREAVSFMRGAMLEKMKKYDEAESEFRKILAENPESASVLNYLGYMLADRGVRLNEAKELIQKAVDQEPHNGAYLDSLGWVYFRLGNLELAERYLRESLARITKDPTVHDHLGDVLAKQGKYKEAVAQWEAALKEYHSGSPNDSDPAELAKIQKKLEGAKVRVAKEGSYKEKRP